MLNINTESLNEVTVSGILSELDIREGQTVEGRKWISGTANIKVDQAINGEVSENIVPIRMFSMALKKDGSPNVVYDRIKGYKEKFTSEAAAEDDYSVSRITAICKLDENAYYDQARDTVRSSFQISSNFLNLARENDIEQAKFKLSGVVGKTRPEINRDGEETGRLLIDFIVLGYKGAANVVTLIATDTKKEFIESHWSDGDTVQVTGYVHMTHKTETWTEEQGFGEPIIRNRTVSCKELIVSGGSPCGLDDDYSYDATEIKLSLEDRAAKHEALKNGKKKPAPKASTNDFGF